MSWLPEWAQSIVGGGYTAPKQSNPLSSTFSSMNPTDLARAKRQGVGGIDSMSGGLLSKVVPEGVVGEPTFMQGMMGYKDINGVENNGWGSLALGGAQGLMGLYQGMKQYGMAEDQFEESQRQYNQDYAAQKQITNADMEDRQRARVASNSGAYQSVSDYMAKNGIR